MNQLGIFAKYWEPGLVKTRLASSIGEAKAAEFHRISVAALTARFGRVGDRRVLSVAPANSHSKFLGVAGVDWQVEAQCTGDLGERMADYFCRATTSGATSTVLIGSDAPSLPTEYVLSAFEHLVDHDVVLGPSSDGGYYLIGVSVKSPPVFESIAWSTDQVWSQTIRRLERQGISWYELPRWYDIDEFEDLQRFAEELKQSKCAGWKEMLRLLGQIGLV